MRCGRDSDTGSNRAMPTARETSKTQTLRNTGPFSFPQISLLIVRNQSRKCQNEGNSTLRFGTISVVKIAEQSLYKANAFACSLANRDKPVAATLQRKCSGGIIVVNTVLAQRTELTGVSILWERTLYHMPFMLARRTTMPLWLASS